MATTLARPVYAARRPPSERDAGWVFQENQRIAAAIPAWKARTITNTSSPADLTLQASDTFVKADATGGSIVVTLPDPTRVDGLSATIKKVDGSANTVSFGPVEGFTITLTARYQGATIAASDGSWFLLSTV